MSEIKQSALDLIGNTPLLQLNGYSKKAGISEATILAKLEYLNPAGSVKDRVALAMIEDAEKKGLLKPGATIIEPTIPPVIAFMPYDSGIGSFCPEVFRLSAVLLRDIGKYRISHFLYMFNAAHSGLIQTAWGDVGIAPLLSSRFLFERSH